MLMRKAVFLFFVVLIFCVGSRGTRRDGCTYWREKIHRDIEKSGQDLNLISLVSNFGGSSTLQSPLLQLQLEQIAENSNLYRSSTSKTNKEIKRLLSTTEVKRIIEECKKFHSPVNCNHSLYRRADGICNNLKHPLWGSSNYTNDRIFPAVYEGISGIRKSVIGGDLPAPRNISLKLKHKSNPSDKVSTFFTYYGQFIVHDMTLSPGLVDNSCCSLPENPSTCVSTLFSTDDPFYRKFNFTCAPVTRTAPYPTCNFNKRMQMNKITSFLDLSGVYGSTIETEKELRDVENPGRLKTRQTGYGDLLPQNKDQNALFCPLNATEHCFIAGDERVNQHIMLMSLHTMFARLHNKLHDNLQSLNPHWDEERCFLETKRLTIALQQYMVYNEYLPLLIGSRNMKNNNLQPDFSRGSFYNDEVRPNILVEFSTASFRLHSMVPKEVSKYHPQIPLNQAYSFYCPVHNGQLDSYVSGSCEMASERNDHFVKEDIQGYLYRPPRAAYGFDLPTVNIARGRDHGLPVYVDVVHYCSERKIRIKSFSELSITMTEDNIRLLKSVYKDVRDIDLWVGMILEREAEEAVTGPTAACISTMHFYRMKFGDSFYFTHNNGRNPFTNAQLQAIKSYSLSRFICDATNRNKVRKHPLLIPHHRNPLIHCYSIPRLNLSPWREHRWGNEENQYDT